MTIDEAIAIMEDPTKHTMTCSQGELTVWLKELKEARRLLKKAVSGFRYLGSEWMDHEDRCTLDCSICPLHNGYNCSHWNMQDEALKLIGKEEVNAND